MAIEKREFIYGMDQDSDQRRIKPGFVRKNLNVRVGSSVSDGVGTGENISGNTLIPNVDLPAGDSKVIGSYWYKKKDLCYFFVWNENGDHGIYEYNHVSSHVNTVMIAEVLGFSKDGLITGINVVELDDENDLLYWASLSVNPSKINIQKAKTGGYTLPIKKEIIDAIKYPPLCPITGVYEEDPNQKINFLENKIVQFKARYIYDDNEKSAFSPYSIHVLPNVGCSDSSQENTIRVTVPAGGELVERIELAVRYSNNSDDQSVVDQPLSEYILNANGDYEYIFRNDKENDALSLAESGNLFDRVPQVAGAQEYIAGNRIAYADILEGYDNVPVDVSLEVDFAQEVVTNSNTISGYIRIRNTYESNEYENFQPIHNLGNGIVFGGFNNLTYEDDMSQYSQSLPLGGFVVYLAGTDYKTVSVQRNGGNAGIQSGGVYDSSSSANRSKIRDEIEGSSGGNSPFPTSRVWSDFELDNVPDGTYILRVASNLTTQSELNDPSRSYQQTSTFVSFMNGAPVFELPITVSGGQVVGGIDIAIDDLTDPSASKTSTSLAGYMVDPADVTYVPQSIDELLGKKRIEKSLVRSQVSAGAAAAKTDHNGFFYMKTNASTLATRPLELDFLQSGQFSDNGFGSYDITAGGIPPNSPIVADGNGKIGVYANTSTDISSFSRTNVEFNIYSALGNGVKDVYCVSSGGDVQQTDSLGNVSFILYANTFSLNSIERDTTFFFYPKDSGCSASFNPIALSFNEFISKSNENNSTTTILPDVTATLLVNNGESYLKRGGAYTTGLVYYDRGNRSGLANVSSDTELLIPFYTEEVNGVIPPSTVPVVTWQIKHVPPAWATHYQWVRTKNTATDRYLQWSAKDVVYLDSAGTSSNFNDGTQIEFDISNISSEYIKAHPDSVLTYDYTVGDRVRLIRDANGNLFQDYFDLKVTGFDAGKLTVEKLNAIPELEAGVLFEIYTPKLSTDSKLFYEIGECYEVKIAVDPNGVEYPYHEGQTNDQSPFNPAVDPAEGIFGSGDTFYRNRTIPIGTGNKSNIIDDQGFSDFFESKVSDIGRPTTEDQDAAQTHRLSTVYYGERFQPETSINGLNTFYANNFETYPREKGAIRKLFSIDNRLDCYQELKVSKILVEENVVYDQFDQGTIGASQNVLSNPAIPYFGEFGTMNPESFAEEGGKRYFFDVRNGAVLRLSNDGLTTISDNLMHSYFESKSNFYSAFDQIPEIWGVYDENHDEYVITFGALSRPQGFTPDDLQLVSSQAEVVTETRNGLEYTFIIGYSENDDGVPTEFEIVRDISNGTYVISSSAGSIDLDRQQILTIPGETIAFSERTKFWDSFYSYVPECMCRVGIDFLTFKNGKTFLHNSNQLRNNFYGVRYTSEVWAVFNEGASNNKVFNAIGVESTSIWEAREILTENGQKSQLIESDFQDEQLNGLVFDSKENIHYAALLQDENTPNIQFPLINGDDMRDVSILFKLSKDTDDLERIFAVNVNFALSQRSNK